MVWFDSIILLEDVENSTLRGLKFLDVWTVTGAPDAPVACLDTDGYSFASIISTLAQEGEL